MTIALTGQTSSFYFGDQTFGWSGVSEYVAKQTAKVLEQLRKSNSFGAGIEAAAEELRGVAEECGSAGWDGHGAAPIAQETIWQAVRFLNALPLGMIAPSVGAEPDGQITFEWYQSSRRILSISISREGEIHYAALLGTSRHYGTELFFGEIPSDILNLVHRAVSE